MSVAKEEIKMNNIEEIIEYIKKHFPIIIEYENKGWTNANISLKNGVIVITPDYSSLFTND